MLNNSRTELQNSFLVRAILARLPAASGNLIGTWMHRAQSRRALRRLSDHLLRDIGVDPYQAMAEARKPFWRS